jgi:hypothetical protein
MSILKTLGFTNLNAGTVQVVDEMTVVPLISEDLGQVAEPFSLKFRRTNTYGSMIYENLDKESPAIIPNNIMVRGLSAQDHAMAGSGVVKAEKSKTFNNACCIESSQGGYLGEENNEYDILPVQLRKKLIPLDIRNKKSYDKLWPEITAWLKGTIDVSPRFSSAHLRYFYDDPEIKKSLETFSAEFEPVLNQIGAIILFTDNIVGIEVMPTLSHWYYYWKLLIRGCYGAELLRRKKLNIIKPAKLKLPKLPKDIDQISLVGDTYTDGIRQNIIKKLDTINLKTTSTIIEKVEDINIILLNSESGGSGGDLITQKDKPIYLSIVM